MDCKKSILLNKNLDWTFNQNENCKENSSEIWI